VIPGRCRKIPRAYPPIWGVTGDISRPTCARPTTAATIGLARHELGHQRGKLVLPHNADLRRHALEHGACGLFRDPELLDCFSRRQPRSDRRGNARLARRPARAHREQRRVGRRARLRIDHQDDRARVGEKAIDPRWAHRIFESPALTVTREAARFSLPIRGGTAGGSYRLHRPVMRTQKDGVSR
jgi:hypothetical protein